MEQINKQTLSEQIYQVLRGDILSQAIPCGSKLTLRMLRDRFGVSHTPIREALTRLAEDELVSYYSNVGVRVISLTADDARELFELTGDLDGLALRHACASPQRAALVAALGDVMRASAAALARGDAADWNRWSDRFHLTLYQYAGNRRLTAASERLLAQLTLLINAYRLHDGSAALIEREHRAVCDALEAGDDDRAGQLLRLHLDNDLRRTQTAIAAR